MRYVYFKVDKVWYWVCGLVGRSVVNYIEDPQEAVPLDPDEVLDAFRVILETFDPDDVRVGVQIDFVGLLPGRRVPEPRRRRASKET